MDPNDNTTPPMGGDMHEDNGMGVAGDGQQQTMNNSQGSTCNCCKCCTCTDGCACNVTP